MPKGFPSIDQIISREVAFFSLDTNVLEGKGFDFKRGALNVLHRQRPVWMTLQLSEVIEQEVHAHRMRDLSDANQKLKTGLNYMHRKVSLDVSKVFAEVDALKVVESASATFTNEMQNFIQGLGGSVLPADGPTLAREMFERYFSKSPPFEVIKDKKSEFPDAAALLSLEHYAQQLEAKGVVISKDRGWLKFAEHSENLYCVHSLESFTSIFEAVGEQVRQLEGKVQSCFKDAKSMAYKLLVEAVEKHVNESTWSVDEIYSGSALRLEGDAYSASVVTVAPDLSNTQGWLTEDEAPVYVVELPVTVSVEVIVNVDFFQYDTIDHEEISMGSQEFSIPMDIELRAFMTSSGQLVATPVDDWDIEFEIAAGNYLVDVGEVDLDLSDDYYE